MLQTCIGNLTPTSRTNTGCKCEACHTRFKEYINERNDKNRTLVNEWSLNSYHRNKEAIQLKRKCLRYGMTPEELEDMEKAQNYLCAICKGEPVGKGKRLYVDHNHDTGQVRALLCHCCNAALGFLKEDKKIILGLLDYLERYEV